MDRGPTSAHPGRSRYRYACITAHISSPSHHTHTHNAPSHAQQEYRYLSSIAVKDGKVFALFVRSPARAFGRNEADLRHIIETFELL